MMPVHGSLGLDGFHRLTDRQRTDALLEVCSSPAWVRRVLAGAPFPDVTAALERADRALAQLPDAELDAALAGHPRIGDRVNNASSAHEQAGVRAVAKDVRAELAAKNAAYEDKFGYVYLVCASGRAAEELLAILTERLGNDRETERRVMRTELMKINRLRLQRLLDSPAKHDLSHAFSGKACRKSDLGEKVGHMAHVSTHVLNAVTGHPAVGVPVTLTDADGTLLAAGSTDDDGRIGRLGDDDRSPGVYRLRFDTGAFFAAHGIVAFYPEIVIAFTVTDPAGTYHVPVLLSPYAYSTYRGS